MKYFQNHNSKLLFILLAVTYCCVPLKISFAQMEYLSDGYVDKYLNYDEGPSAKKNFEDSSAVSDLYVYEMPTVKAFAHLYWGINLYNTSDNMAVDEFIRMNECEIFMSYSVDEFEWKEIRNATKEFLDKNKNDFPTRFQFIIPLLLQDYDRKREVFNIQEEFQAESKRRFIVDSVDSRAEFCPQKIRGLKASYYPRSLVLEFSRPFSLRSIPMPQEVAEEYIKERTDYMKKKYDAIKHSKSLMYKLRHAYLVLKVNIFSHGDIYSKITRNGSAALRSLSVLEGYAIYKDAELTKLFYKQSFVEKKDRGNLNAILVDQYNILKEKHKGDGVLY